MRDFAFLGMLLGLIAYDGVCQPAITFTPDDALSSITVGAVPAVEPRIRMYQNFFNEIIAFSSMPLSEEVRHLELSDTELHSMLTITADLVAENRAFKKKAAPTVAEAREKAKNSGALPAALLEALRELEKQRTRQILDHVRQLRASLGEPRFEELDEFIQSGEPVFVRPNPAPAPRDQMPVQNGTGIDFPACSQGTVESVVS